MGIFENKLQFNFEVNQKILNQISEIDSFKGKWSYLENEQYLQKLKNITTIQSIGSSTRIEGATLSDKEIEKLITNLKVDKLETRDEQEVIGYYEVLELILNNYHNLKLSENYIKQFHTILLKYSNKDEGQRGQYKKVSNKVVATFPNGSQKVVFNTTEPYLVQKEMEEVINWTNKKIESKDIHPLIVVGSFVYEFLSIHPFHDGNGRLSRLLTTLLLLKSDYNFIKFVSFEHVIENRKNQYYAALMECQKDRNSSNETIGAWMLFFLDSLNSLSKRLEKKTEKLADRSIYLNERQRKIREFLLVHEPCKISDIKKDFPDLSINTLKKDMQYLVKNGIVEKLGQRKGSYYQINRNYK